MLFSDVLWFSVLIQICPKKEILSGGLNFLKFYQWVKEECICDFMNERPTLEFSLFIELAKQKTNGYEAGNWFFAPDVN